MRARRRRWRLREPPVTSRKRDVGGSYGDGPEAGPRGWAGRYPWRRGPVARAARRPGDKQRWDGPARRGRSEAAIAVEPAGPGRAEASAGPPALRAPGTGLAGRGRC